MTPDRSLRLAALCFASALTATVSAQTYLLYGSGCPSSAGTPALHAHGLPALGQTFQVDLTQVPVGSVGVLLFGAQQLANPIDLGFIGSPGCLVRTLPDFTSIVAPATNGACAVNLTIPLSASLIGASFENQWLDIAGATSITVSNAGKATLGALPPAVSVGSISPSSGLLSVGQNLVLRVTNLGTNDPDDLCIQLIDIVGARSLLRVNSIVFDPNTNEDVVTTTMVVAGVSPVAAPAVMLMRGDGSSSATSSSSCLTTPVSAWAWGGAAVPGAGTSMPTNLTPLPAANTQTLFWVYDSGSNSLYVDVPPYPWAFSGIYPPGSSATTDAHGDVDCGGGTPSDHFDQFVDRVQVKASCSSGITNQQLVIEHAPQVQQTFDNFFGQGRLTVTAETTGSLARIRIKPTNPNCTLTGGGGSVVLGQ